MIAPAPTTLSTLSQMNSSLLKKSILLLIAMAGLSCLSGYTFPNFNDSNWDTVLFLTPWGIISNLLWHPILATFYWDPAPGNTWNGPGFSLTYLYVFMQSNLLEFFVYLPFLMRVRKSKSVLENSFFITLMNACTHPIVFFLLMGMRQTYLMNIVTAESFAILAEAWVLMRFLKIRGGKAILVSFGANLMSWQLAPILTYGIFG